MNFLILECSFIVSTLVATILSYMALFNVNKLFGYPIGRIWISQICGLFTVGKSASEVIDYFLGNTSIYISICI